VAIKVAEAGGVAELPDVLPRRSRGAGVLARDDAAVRGIIKPFCQVSAGI
jgi:hypothetical protein